jgi:2-C-methyl-D-erythritol 2,4-cyclodiphosphate synthase
MSKETEKRVGIGFDVHRFGGNRKLVLGGVEFEAERGLEGHSDADVVTHAVIDAILGAAGLADIGEQFPDSDERYRDANSIGLLEQTIGLIDMWSVINVDVTVIAEAPSMSKLKDEMSHRLAGVLGVPDAHVNVKATTNEGLGALGRGEGIAAIAVALIGR